MSTVIDQPATILARKTGPPQIIHVFPPNPYGGRPDVGSKALCGHIKKGPTTFASTNHALGAARQRCVVCFDLIPDDARL